MKSSPKKITQHSFLIIYLSLYFLFFSYYLIRYPMPFYDWDEAIYAKVANEMLEKKSFVPLWLNKVWLDKPPFVPLFYGLVFQLTPTIPQEISGRIATLLLSVTALILIYLLYWKVIRETLLTTIVIVLTSGTEIFIQRSQALNIDVFLLCGWFGYLLFANNFIVGLIFLSVGVLSKSLIGFYPVMIIILYNIYRYSQKKLTLHQFLTRLKKSLLQIAIISSWYWLMLIFYRRSFLIHHFYETHFKRVAASIESHFGQRTYYIDVLFQQFTGLPLFNSQLSLFSLALAFISVFSMMLIGWLYLKKRQLSTKQFFYSLCLLPWFVFLNLTKTKIFWYSYPTIPQFAFLFTYPITLIRRWKKTYFLISSLIFLTLTINIFFKKKAFAIKYSRWEPYQLLAKEANHSCQKLAVLVDKNTRSTFETLNKLNLTITTTSWWGQHPSIAYYFKGQTSFFYNIDVFQNQIRTDKPDSCYMLKLDDISSLKKELKTLKLQNKLDQYLLFIKNKNI